LNPGLKILLLPLAYLYGVVTYVRNSLYDSRILKEKRFDSVHTIGVGNLAVGGAGKTPLVEYLLRLLLIHEPKIAVLSRGYKRKTTGFILADESSSALEIGDEPLIYKTKYPVQVAVDANRVHGIKKLIALEEKAPKIILMDDVFQHRAVRSGLNIVVTDYNNLYYKDVMLPAGTLREFKGGIERADLIIVSKLPDNTSPVEIRTITKDISPRAHQRVFFSYLKYGELYSIHNHTDRLDTLNELFRFRVISFAGIANAQPMVNYLKEYSAELRHLPFDDHHEYSLKDLHDIQRYYDSFEGSNKLLVTTEKDFMRLKNADVWEAAQQMNIYILPVEVTFKDKEEELNEIILKYVRSNRIYHQKYT
jgi:tetraacyldisaccharide 4'-kinase